MEDVPSHRVVVDADLAFPAHEMEGKRCDYVLFFTGTHKDTLFAVPMELKAGGVDASEVSAQLQRGADFAHRFAAQDFEAVCHPVLVHGGSIHPKQRRILNRAKVRFRGRRLTINTARCNRPKESGACAWGRCTVTLPPQWQTGVRRIAVKVINHLEDEAMKVFRV